MIHPAQRKISFQTEMILVKIKISVFVCWKLNYFHNITSLFAWTINCLLKIIFNFFLHVSKKYTTLLYWRSPRQSICSSLLFPQIYHYLNYCVFRSLSWRITYEWCIIIQLLASLSFIFYHVNRLVEFSV